MRHKRWYVDKVSRAGFVDKLQTISPAEPGATTHDIDNCFDLTMMVRTGLGVRVHHHCSGPQFVGAHAGMRYSFSATHAGCLWRVGIEFSTADNPQAVLFPVLREVN